MLSANGERAGILVNSKGLPTSRSRVIPAELPRIGEWVYDLALSADGDAAFAADWQGRLTAIDVKTRKIVQQVTPLLVSQ